MGLRDRIRERAARRQAEKAAKKGTGVSTSGTIPNGGRAGMSGDTRPAQKRTPQKAVTVTNKPTPVKAKTPELKKSAPATVKKETAAEFRSRKANESKVAKEKQVAKQKKVSLKKEADTYKPGKALGTPKKAKYSGVTSDNKKGQADSEASNKRATTNRKSKANAKPGASYDYIDSKGRKRTATKSL